MQKIRATNQFNDSNQDILWDRSTLNPAVWNRIQRSKHRKLSLYRRLYFSLDSAGIERIRQNRHCIAKHMHIWLKCFRKKLNDKSSKSRPTNCKSLNWIGDNERNLVIWYWEVGGKLILSADKDRTQNCRS